MSVRVGGGGAAAAGITAKSLAPAPDMAQAMDAHRALQQELAAHVDKQTQFMAQQNENMLVKEQLDKLKEGEHVYKMMGKVLVRQDVAEAKSTVEGRLTFIGRELKKAEDAIEATRAKLLAVRQRLMAMQQAAQEGGGAAAAAAAAAAAGGSKGR